MLIDIPDARAEADGPLAPGIRNFLLSGNRAITVMPMLRGKDAIGVISVTRAVPGLLSDKQLSILHTFADQAVIAIENVRLFNETREALEQQTATAEILKVISESPTDVQPVFDAIVASCTRLLACNHATLRLVKGDHAEFAASNSTIGGKTVVESPMSIHDDSMPVSHAVARREVVQIPDTSAEGVSVQMKQRGEQRGFRSLMVAPLLRDNDVIGTINVHRATPGRFTEKEVALLETFASQAVIAIANVRLFNETREALEQQKASGEVLSVISNSIADAQPVFEKIVESCERLFPGGKIGLNLIGPDGLVHAGAYGNFPGAAKLRKEHFPHPAAGSATGAAIDAGGVIHFPDALGDPDVPPFARSGAEAVGFRAFIAAPLLSEGRGLGAIFVGRGAVGSFTEKEIALLRTFADQAVIAIQNARLFNETKEALERQTATSGILEVMSGSPTDVQPVFDAIVKSGARLFSGAGVAIALPDAGQVRLASIADEDPERCARWAASYPFPLTRDYMHATAILDRRVIDVPDALDPPAQWAAGIENFVRTGYRAITIIPMMRGNTDFGTVSVVRMAPGPLTDKQYAILKTFADQAVIAIENVRLFNETKEALEQQRASGEVLSAISESIADTEPVFEKILESCERLFAVRQVGINRVGEDGKVHLAAFHGPGREMLDRIFPLSLEGDSGSSICLRERRVVHYPDAQEGADVPSTTRQSCIATGFRSILFAPMLWEGRGIGVLFMGRDRVAPFTEKEIAQFKTFADQAVIAMQNARMFNETREALEQQTALSEILGVISSSPTDVIPMLHAVAERAGKLCDADVSNVLLVEGEAQRLASNYVKDGVANPFAGQGPMVLSLSRGSVSGRAIIDRTAVNVLDMGEAPEDEYPVGREVSQRFGVRTVFGTPLMREGRAIGAIVLVRMRKQAYSDKQIALVRTFADQAAIGIANVRLFNETKEALDQQTASAEVLRVISSSLADAKPVFEMILQSWSGLLACRHDGDHDSGRGGKRLEPWRIPRTRRRR